MTAHEVYTKMVAHFDDYLHFIIKYEAEKEMKFEVTAKEDYEYVPIESRDRLVAEGYTISKDKKGKLLIKWRP